MRKGIMFILIGLMLFQMQIESKSNELKFVIIFDSKEDHKIEKKQEIVSLLNKSLKNVNEKSWNEMVLSSLNELENEERKVSSYFSEVYFVLGDGQGVRIEGNLVESSFCMVEVKPKSLLRKWFRF